MGAKAAGLLFAIILLSPGALAWTQYRGTPARAGAEVLPGGALDVAERHDLLPDGVFTGLDGAPAVVTPLGVVGVAIEGARCEGLAFANASPPARSVFVIDDCADYVGFGRSLQGFDPLAERLLVCVAGVAASNVLRAYDLHTGDLAWSLSPASAFGLTPEGARATWICQGTALDVKAREAVLVFFGFPFAAAGSYTAYHRIVSVDLDSGTLRWVAQVPAEGSLPLLPTSAEDFIPRAVTLTTSGVVVMGRTSMNAGIFEATMGFFDREGRYRGSLRAQRDAPATDDVLSARSRGGSYFPVAHGPVAATHFGGDVVIVNPEIGNVVARAPVRAFDTSANYVFWPTGNWVDDRILVLLPHAVSAFDATTLEPEWSWSEGADVLVREHILSASGEVHVLVGREGDRGSTLVTLDAHTGGVIAKLPLPLAPEAGRDNVWPVNMLPIPGRGILIFDESGRSVIVGPGNASRAPPVAPSTTYPAVGETVELPLANVSGLESYVVSWGDEALVTLGPGATATHAFARAGPSDVRVTAVFTDGLTSTSRLTLHVGATPPPDLTLLQQAFSPENQEVTFFGLGIAVTALGAIVTIGRARARFTRLERELAAVEEIRVVSTHEPRAAIVALRTYRERLPEELARGRLDDSQYHVLDLRSARLLRVLRARVLAPFDSRLSDRYHRLLDATFEDAILRPAEAEALAAALDAEPLLTTDDRAAIAELLRDFTTRASSR